MKNPWLEIPSEPPYMLERDCEELAALSAKKRSDIEDHYIPEGWVGNLDTAQVILLMSNPGSDTPKGLGSIESAAEYHKTFPYHRKRALANLREEFGERPFFSLDPALRFTGAFRYHARAFSAFLNGESDYVRLSQRIATAELFPYHTKRFVHHDVELTSTEYYIRKVARRIEQGALVICVRSFSLWKKRLLSQGLSEGLIDSIPRLKSAQNSSLSAKNLGSDVFGRLQETLR
jgi:hypothetical protein